MAEVSDSAVATASGDNKPKDNVSIEAQNALKELVGKVTLKTTTDFPLSPDPLFAEDKLPDVAFDKDGSLSFGKLDEHTPTDGDGGSGDGLVRRDESGRVNEVDYPNGDVRKFTYDESGKLASVTQPDGTVLVPQADGSWGPKRSENSERPVTGAPNGGKESPGSGGGGGKGVGSDLEPIRSRQGEQYFDMQVAPDGTLSYKTRDGRQVSIAPDATKNTKNPDGSTIAQDSHGQTTRIDYGNGESREFTYGSSGNLLSFKDKDGTSYELKDGAYVAADGKKYPYHDLSVGEFGDLTGTADDGTRVIQHSDQTQTKVFKNGGMADFDAEGKITSIRHSDGSVRTDFDKDVKVDSDGTLSWVDPETGKIVFEYTDGSSRAVRKEDLGTTRFQLEDFAYRNLRGTANEKCTSERQDFLDNLDKFQERAKAQGMTPEQIQKVYESAAKLITAESGAVPKELMNNLAVEIIDQAANPEKCTQGYHGTCQMTSVEGRTWIRNPEVAASMIAQVALEGKWTSYDGKTIEIPPSALLPDGEARNFPPKDGLRSFASQIFQVTMFNDWGQRETPPRYYTLQNPNDESSDDAWMNSLDGPFIRDENGAVKKYGFGFGDIGKYNELLSGSKGLNTYWPGAGDGKYVGGYESEAEFQKIIEDATARGDMPIALAVAAGDVTVFGGDQNRNDPNHDINHVILVTEYDPATGMVRINNSWGSDGDKWVKLEDLYYATIKLPPNDPVAGPR